MRKLILFDIDGTLLSALGAPRRAFRHAMVTVFDTAGPIGTHPFDGKTDPQIARELLELDGMSTTTIDAGLPRLWTTYLEALRQELGQPDHETRVFAGVPELLAELERQSDDVVLGLLTGNIRGGATLKLASAGIATDFRVGAFGSDCDRRDGLPPVAVERARALTGRSFEGRHIVVIGDTPNDITCGRALGVRAVGVATGNYDMDSLADAGADVVVPDFSDTAAVLDLLLD